MEDLERTPVATTENGLLAKMWRKIILENNLQSSLVFSVKRYWRKNRNKKGALNTGTLNKLIKGSELTWKRFLLLLFDVLGVKKLIFTVVVHKGEKTVKAMVEITPDNYQEYGKFLADLRDQIIEALGYKGKTAELLKSYKGSKSENSIYNAMSKKKLTWKTFVFLVLEFMQVDNMEIYAKVKWLNDEETIHGIKGIKL